MSTQLWEFTVKAGTFKCQGRYGNVTWFGPSLPLLTKCSQTKVPLGGPRKAPPFNGNEQLFADTNDYHIKWIFPKENNGELSSCFSCILQSKIKNAVRAPGGHFHNQKGLGAGGAGRGRGGGHCCRDAHEGNNMLEMWSHELSQENHDNKAGQR